MNVSMVRATVAMLRALDQAPMLWTEDVSRSTPAFMADTLDWCLTRIHDLEVLLAAEGNYIDSQAGRKAVGLPVETFPEFLEREGIQANFELYREVGSAR